MKYVVASPGRECIQTPYSCGFVLMQTPSSASVDVLTARSLSPEWEGSPHGEMELIHDGDFEELSKQLEKER